MKLPLVFHPEVDDDLVVSVRFYKGKKRGLAGDFLREVRKTKKGIIASPQKHQFIWRTDRRSLVNRFPFGVYCRVHSDRIEVLAIYHHSRDPAGWQNRV